MAQPDPTSASDDDLIQVSLEEKSERLREHLDWLRSPDAEHEEDREQQFAETERMLERINQLLNG